MKRLDNRLSDACEFNDRPDSLGGIIVAAILSLPFWALIGVGAYLIWRAL